MLSNKEKGYNSSLKTGVGSLQQHILRIKRKVVVLEEDVNIYSKSSSELHKAKALVATHDIKMRGYFIAQLEECITILTQAKL